MISFFVEVLAEAGLTKAWVERAALRDIFSDTYTSLRKGRMKMYVFGCGGVGKSTFGKIISGKKKLSDVGGTYELSTDIEHYGLKKKWWALISIPPGQSSFRKKEWGSLFRDIQTSRRPVIVNIVSYGYHSADRRMLSQISEFKKSLNDKTLQNYLANNRKKEIEALRFLIDGIKHCDKKLDLITIVTKQDLWWNERADVEKHYSSRRVGGYMREVDRLTKEFGEGNFTHHIVSGSFGHFNLNTADNVTLFHICPEFDMRLLYANLANVNQVMKSKTN